MPFLIPDPDLTNVPDGEMTYAGMAITLADGTTRTTIRCGDKVTLAVGSTGTVHCWRADGFMVTLDKPVPAVSITPNGGSNTPPVAAFACQGKHVKSIDQRIAR